MTLSLIGLECLSCIQDCSCPTTMGILLALSALRLQIIIHCVDTPWTAVIVLQAP